MMNARFVGNDEIAAIAVMKNSDDSGVSAVEDANHAAFGAGCRTGGLASTGIAPLDAGDNAIAMHGIPQLVGRNEEIAVEIAARRVWNHKAIAIAMRDEPAPEHIGISRYRLLRRPELSIRFCSGARL